MPYVMYLNCPTAQTAWVIVTPCVALWNHIAITKHAMKYGAMHITNVAGTKKQLHCAHDAWDLMTIDQTITEHVIKFGYYTFFFWSILVISLTTSLALLWGLWYHKDD